MRIKQARCPKVSYACPEAKCTHISDKQETMLLHVINQHKLSNHTEKAIEDLQNYRKEQKIEKRNLDKQEEEKRKADEINTKR